MNSVRKPNNLSFEEHLMNYRLKIHEISKRFSKSSGIPIEDFISHLIEELWRAFNQFDTKRDSSFNTWVNLKLRHKAINLCKSGHGGYYRKVKLENNDEDGNFKGDFNHLIDKNCDVEKECLIVKKEDQRQLISFLTDPTKIDHDTKLIVSNFAKYDTITALAKALGMHHETVKRKLRKLSDNYDPDRFGDYEDYLVASA